MAERLAITGGPKTGKTTLGAKLGVPVKSTDSLMDSHDWSGASAESSKWFGGPDAVEGVAVPRALRKWLDANPTGKPIDRLIVLTKPHLKHTPGQAAMAKGHDTVLREIEPELRRRGVVIERRG